MREQRTIRPSLCYTHGVIAHISRRRTKRIPEIIVLVYAQCTRFCVQVKAKLRLTELRRSFSLQIIFLLISLFRGIMSLVENNFNFPIQSQPPFSMIFGNVFPPFSKSGYVLPRNQLPLPPTHKTLSFHFQVFELTRVRVCVRVCPAGERQRLVCAHSNNKVRQHTFSRLQSGSRHSTPTTKHRTHRLLACVLVAVE